MGSLEEEGAAAARLSWARSKKKALLLLLLFSGRSAQNLMLSGGDPPNPPCGRNPCSHRARTEIKDLMEVSKLDKRMIREMDKVFSEDIPALLLKARLPGGDPQMQ
jgi:hypothetical protein